MKTRYKIFWTLVVLIYGVSAGYVIGTESAMITWLKVYEDRP